MTSCGNVVCVHKMVLQNRRLAAGSSESVGLILKNVLDMIKVLAEWVPKGLNAEQKNEHVITTCAILQHFEKD